MSHHGNNPLKGDPFAPAPMLEKLVKKHQRELMGEYPDGRMNADDSGALSVAVASENGKVMLQFPKPVAWIGFTGDQAMEIAQLLMTHARRAGITAPVVMRIGE